MNLTYTVTQAEADLILSGLQELPMKVAYSLVMKLVAQGKAQLAAAAAQSEPVAAGDALPVPEAPEKQNGRRSAR